MELAIPYQKLEINKLHVIPQTNNYLPFEYKDGDLTLHRSIIITPIVKVITYDPEKGRVEFDCDPAFLSKMQALQDILKTFIFQQQKLFQSDNLTKDQIEYGFKLLIYGGRFVCYIPTSSAYNKWTNKGVHVYKDGSASGEWQPEKNIFKEGEEMRLAIKLGGIKIKQNQRGTNFFIDHQILHVWKINRASGESV
jgi:hypothetical protein